MTDKPAVGKTLYKQEIVRGRNAATKARRALLRIVDEEPGPQTRQALITSAALSLLEILEVLNRLDDIGREAKNLDKENAKQNSPAA